MTYQETQEIQKDKRQLLYASMKELGLYPITQHPSYEEDLAYDIDDVIELMETIQQIQTTQGA